MKWDKAKFPIVGVQVSGFICATIFIRIWAFTSVMVETAYVKCIFCNMNKPLRSNRYPGGVFTIPPWEGDPSDVAFIMYMDQHAGPGRGRREKVGGWVKTGELSLGEALADPEFHGMAEDFRIKLVSLVRSYLENGVLQLDELA